MDAHGFSYEPHEKPISFRKLYANQCRKIDDIVDMIVELKDSIECDFGISQKPLDLCDKILEKLKS